MEVQAITKYVRMSASKARDMARAIQGRPVGEALAITQMSRRKAAFQIGKTLKSAIANAENNAKLSADALYVKEALIEDGPQMKRWQPRARGMAGPILKRTSHVRITLSDEKKAGRRAKRGRG
ncbi:MAG: 50S ribosomal protein L22 [Kiritimatiellae bacterium]|nr:50S ribosomal protein L22 [Kiritimatiellia bacterium]